MISEYTKRILKGMTLKQRRAVLRLIDEVRAYDANEWILTYEGPDGFFGVEAIE